MRFYLITRRDKLADGQEHIGFVVVSYDEQRAREAAALEIGRPSAEAADFLNPAETAVVLLDSANFCCSSVVLGSHREPPDRNAAFEIASDALRAMSGYTGGDSSLRLAANALDRARETGSLT